MSCCRLVLLLDLDFLSAILICLILYFFFFSSRRRHTRCLSDWSSDVCSSDLQGAAAPRGCPPPWRATSCAAPPPAPASPCRSEERRVGKECSYRRASDLNKNKEERSNRGKLCT